MVVSRDSIKNATATSHGNRRLLATDKLDGGDGGAGVTRERGGFIGEIGMMQDTDSI
jgi:hypothetical protein